jgi:hypothetical protein
MIVSHLLFTAELKLVISFPFVVLIIGIIKELGRKETLPGQMKRNDLY